MSEHVVASYEQVVTSIEYPEVNEVKVETETTLGGVVKDEDDHSDTRGDDTISTVSRDTMTSVQMDKKREAVRKSRLKRQMKIQSAKSEIQSLKRDVKQVNQKIRALSNDFEHLRLILQYMKDERSIESDDPLNDLSYMQY